jgi:NADH:ubiquinone oxidoreductase subunit 6 (subunit J)
LIVVVIVVVVAIVFVIFVVVVLENKKKEIRTRSEEPLCTRYIVPFKTYNGLCTMVLVRRAQKSIEVSFFDRRKYVCT